MNPKGKRSNRKLYRQVLNRITELADIVVDQVDEIYEQRTAKISKKVNYNFECLPSNVIEKRHHKEKLIPALYDRDKHIWKIAYLKKVESNFILFIIYILCSRIVSLNNDHVNH